MESLQKKQLRGEHEKNVLKFLALLSSLRPQIYRSIAVIDYVEIPYDKD